VLALCDAIVCGEGVGGGGGTGACAYACAAAGAAAAATGAAAPFCCVVAFGATTGGAGVGGGIATGGITGRDRGAGGPPPMSTGRPTTTDGAGAIFGVGAAAAGLGAVGAVGPFVGAAIFTVAELASLLSGTRFEKVLIEDF
jgi:hypothetical protein